MLHVGLRRVSGRTTDLVTVLGVVDSTVQLAKGSNGRRKGRGRPSADQCSMSPQPCLDHRNLLADLVKDARPLQRARNAVFVALTTCRRHHGCANVTRGAPDGSAKRSGEDPGDDLALGLDEKSADVLDPVAASLGVATAGHRLPAWPWGGLHGSPRGEGPLPPALA